MKTYTRTYFGRFYALLAGLSPADYYEIPEGPKSAPDVNF